MENKETEEQLSPLPKKKESEDLVVKQLTYTFPEVIEYLLKGKRATRLEWNDRNVYVTMEHDLLKIYMSDGDHDWIISRSDILGTDWVILSDGN